VARGRAGARPYRSPPSFGSEDFASERPILCLVDQAASNRIL
jgi:hypothetical protein